LYAAVKLFRFAIELGINIPTGKDSLSMKQKYPNEEVIAGTVIISAGGNCTDIRKVVEPVFKETVALFIISIYRKMISN
jgi:phosphoribosylformylglycinamidine synthase